MYHYAHESTDHGTMVVTAWDVPTILASGGTDMKKKLPDDLGKGVTSSEQLNQDAGDLFAGYMKYVRGGTDVSLLRR